MITRIVAWDGLSTVDGAVIRFAAFAALLAGRGIAEFVWAPGDTGDSGDRGYIKRLDGTTQAISAAPDWLGDIRRLAHLQRCVGVRYVAGATLPPRASVKLADGQVFVADNIAGLAEDLGINPGSDPGSDLGTKTAEADVPTLAEGQVARVWCPQESAHFALMADGTIADLTGSWPAAEVIIAGASV